MSWLFVTVKEEQRKAFFGEDIYIDVPPGNVGEVVFRPWNNQSSEVVLLREGQVVNPRAVINSLGHLVLEDVQEEDKGLYIIKNTSNPSAAKHLILIVRGKMFATLLSRVDRAVESVPKLKIVCLRGAYTFWACELYKMTSQNDDSFAGVLQ